MEESEKCSKQGLRRSNSESSGKTDSRNETKCVEQTKRVVIGRLTGKRICIDCGAEVPSYTIGVRAEVPPYAIDVYGVEGEICINCYLKQLAVARRNSVRKIFNDG